MFTCYHLFLPSSICSCTERHPQYACVLTGKPSSAFYCCFTMYFDTVRCWKMACAVSLVISSIFLVHQVPPTVSHHVGSHILFSSNAVMQFMPHTRHLMLPSGAKLCLSHLSAYIITQIILLQQSSMNVTE